MKPALARWIADADALRHFEHFRISQATTDFAHIHARTDDYYLSLVGDLFERMRSTASEALEWAHLGNALAQFAAEVSDGTFDTNGVSKNEAILFAAAAFYCGGFPASAYLTLRGYDPGTESDKYNACYDLLVKPATIRSELVQALINALRSGDMEAIAKLRETAASSTKEALDVGPNEWIPARLFERLVSRFATTNIRAVLPDGSSDFWTPLVSSLLRRRPASWEFFPSQIQAIERGLLGSKESFSLQMPTGAGKTTLCETLLYWHAKQDDSSVAVLLVPYRALASELRSTMVKRLNAMKISSRCAYGGTVPTGSEVRNLDDVRVMVATPEALSGLLSSNSDFLQRISLVICDEGHLLDGARRGVSLELLLARMKSKGGGAPRFIFVSAIVPNIEEINAWLGGGPEGVVRSDYRPALAEFAVLRTFGSGSSQVTRLEMHPHEGPPTSYAIDLLGRESFRWIRATTGLPNTYSFSSIKTKAVATARKALVLGAAAIFAANKRGNQGAVGLAEELLNQLNHSLGLPAPASYMTPGQTNDVVAYLEREYGREWIGTRTLAAGAILHHGDIPQETREVLETLLRQGHVRLAICTNTLAEGVNLPIRTLVLYSVRRRRRQGPEENLLTRDIKNLVGRAGRAGSTTKGLVICANEGQWPLVEKVARQAPGEPVKGALRSLIEGLRRTLALTNTTLTNDILESQPELHTLTDGVDATLVDLAAEEVGEEELRRLAIQLADQTFAAQQIDPEARPLLQNVFELRVQRIVHIRADGRLGWIRETGARPRMLAPVIEGLQPKRASWDDVSDCTDPALVAVLLEWAWAQDDLQEAIREVHQLGDGADTTPIRQIFFDIVTLWLSGASFKDISVQMHQPMDDLLRFHTRVLAFALQSVIEHGIAILAKSLDAESRTLAPAVAQFPEHLRFGVPTVGARLLAAGGVRHRRASVALGATSEILEISSQDPSRIFSTARQLMTTNGESWKEHLGDLVFVHTEQDLNTIVESELPPN